MIDLLLRVLRLRHRREASPMGIASKLLAFGSTSSSTDELVYTVPVGRTTIVKYGVLINYSDVAQDIAMTFGPGSGPRYTVTLLEFAIWQTQTFSIWSVLPAGYRIGVYALGGGIAMYWISGSELLGVNDIPTVPTLRIAPHPLQWPPKS